MKYTATKYKDVLISKGINYTDYVDPNEIELTEEQYNTIPIPCQLVDGKFAPCEFPEMGNSEFIETPVNAEEQLRADIDYLAIMTGVDL